MCRFTFIALSLLGSLACTAVSAQPFKFTPAAFQPELTEAAQRAQSNMTGFVFDFANATKTDGGTPNGSLKSSQVGQNPFLSTLPGRGNGQTLVTMGAQLTPFWYAGPCAGNTPHTHPRGSEISFITEGEIDFGIVEENAGDNKLHMRRVSKGMTIHVPQGIVHFSHNPTCQPAQFLANFGERDPGTQTVWASLMQIPNTVLNAATGIPESTFTELKKYPLVIAPGTGGEACMAKCSIDFRTANAFMPAPGPGPRI